MEGVEPVSVLHWFWSPVLDHLWQSTLFALIVFGMMALLRRAPARVRCMLYLAIPAKFLLPSTLVLGAIHRIGIDLQSAFVSMAWASSDPLLFVDRQNSMFHLARGLTGTMVGLPQYLPSFLLSVWAAGTVWFAGNWMLRQFSVLREIRRSTLLRDGREMLLVRSLQSRLRLKRPVRLATSPEFTEIGVFGVWNPWILLPEAITDHLSDSELEAILMHEMIHIARWDNLMSHVSMSVCCLFWFHPAVWMADRGLLAERERVCDDRVLELGSASLTYAASLVKVLKFGLGFRIAGVSCAGGPHLKRRIETIAAGTPAPRLNLLHRLAIVGILASLLAVCVAAVQIDRCQIEISLKKIPLPAAKPDCGKKV